MVSNRKNRKAKCGRQLLHYLTVKKISVLFRGITFKYYHGFYCLNCRNAFRTKNKLESHKKVCENTKYVKKVYFKCNYAF